MHCFNKIVTLLGYKNRFKRKDQLESVLERTKP